MKVKSFSTLTDPNLADKFAKFEHSFTYPLGNNARFRINHGIDYNAFYRAIGGDAQTYYIEDKDEILGAICVCTKALEYPDSNTIYMAYVGDLKVSKSLQNSRATFYLIKAAYAAFKKCDLGYSVVMDGTSVTPSTYTGRLGIPAFKKIETQYILSLNTANISQESGAQEVQNGWEKYLDFVKHKCIPRQSYSNLRSLIQPKWILVKNTAVAMLEDTMRAKRLFLTSGDEILSSHLSYFEFTCKESAIKVIKQALYNSHQKGYKFMFLALNKEQYQSLQLFLEELDHSVATCTVYGTSNLPFRYQLNTSEI